MSYNTPLIALDSFFAHYKLFIRGKEYISDLSLAVLFQTNVKHIRKKVNANRSRFPEDFMISLSDEEKVRFQNALYAFTEEGVLMLSGLIKTDRAARISVAVVEMLVDKMPGMAFSILGNIK